VKVPSKRKGKRMRAPRLSLSQTSAGVGSATKRGRAAKLKPRKPLAPSPMKTLAGGQLKQRKASSPPSRAAASVAAVKVARLPA